MAQTVEEIAEILNEIRVENADNLKGFDKVLDGIDKVLEKISDGGDANETISESLNDLRAIVEERHGFEARKLGELELSLKNLLAKQDTLTKTSEIKELFAALSANYNNFSAEVYGQREAIINIDKKIVEMANDDSDKHQIITSVVSVRQELEDINKAREAAVETITSNLAEILKRIIMLDVSDQNDIIKRELENIYVTSNAILSSLQIADQKNDTIAKMIENTVSRDNYEESQKKIDEILDKATVVTGALPALDVKADVKDISEKLSEYGIIIASLREIVSSNAENSTLHLNEKVEELQKAFNSVVTEDNFTDFRMELGKFVQTIIDNSASLSVSLGEYKPEFENLKELVRSLGDELKQKQDEHAETSIEAIEQKIGDCITVVKNTATETDVKLGNSLSEIEELKNDIARFLDIVNSATIRQEGRFDVINDTVGTNIEDVKDALSEINIRLESLKVNFVETSQGNKESIVTLVEDTASKIENIVNDLGNFSHGEFEDIKNSFARLTVGLEEVKKDFKELSSDNISKILSGMEGLGETVSESFADKFSYVNEKFEWISTSLGEQIDALKSVISDYTNDNGISDKIYTINGLITNAVEDYDNKINDLKNNIEDFAGAIEKITAETDEKLGTSAAEISMIKSELLNVTDIVNASASDGSTKLNDITEKINYEFNEIIEKITVMQEVVQTGLRDDFQGVSDALDGKFESLLSFFETFKSIYADEIKGDINGVGGRVDAVTFSVEQLGDKVLSVNEQISEAVEKVSSIKDEISLVNTDLLDAVNSKSDMIVAGFEPLKNSIEGILNIDFNGILTEVKTVIESKDTLNNVAMTGLEATNKEILDKFGSIEENLNNTLRGNLDTLCAVVADINSSVEAAIGKSSSLPENWIQGIRKLDEKIAALASNYEKSLTLVVKDIRQTLNTVVSAYAQDLKNSISGLATQEAAVSAVEAMKTELSSKLDVLVEGYMAQDNDLTVNAVTEQLQAFVEDAFNKNLAKINDTVKEINAMGTMVDDSGEVAGIIENLKNKLSEEITSKFISYAEYQTAVSNQANEQMQQMFKAFDEKLEQIKFEVNSVLYDNVTQVEKSQITDAIAELKKSSFGFAGVLKPNFKKVLDELEEKVAAIDSRTPANEYFTKVLETHKNDLIRELDNIRQEFASNAEVGAHIEAIHQKIDLMVEMDELRSEPINEINAKVDEMSALGAKINETLSALETKAEKIDNINDGMYFLNEKADRISDIADSAYFLGEKVEKIPHISDVVDDINENAEILPHIAETVDDMGESIKNIQFAVSTVNDINENIESMLDVTQTVNSISEYVESMPQIAQSLDYISDNTEKITGVADAVCAVNENIEKLSNITFTLDNINENADMLPQISQAIDYISDNAEKITGVASALETLGESVDKLSGMAFTVENLSANTDVLPQIIEAIDYVSENAEKIKEVSEAIETLNTQTEKISTIADTVDAITFQTAKIADIADTADGINFQIAKVAELSDTTDAIYEKVDNISGLADAVEAVNSNVSILPQLRDAVDYISENTDKIESVKDAVEAVNERIGSLTEVSSILVSLKSAFNDEFEALKDKVENIAIDDTGIYEALSKIEDQRDKLSEISDNICYLEDKLSKIPEISEAVYFIGMKAEKISQIADSVELLCDNTSKIPEVLDAVEALTGVVKNIPDVSSSLEQLHEKVNMLAEISASDADFDLKNEIQDVKELIENQLHFIEDANNTDKIAEIDERLKDVLSKIKGIESDIEDIDLESSSKDIKKSVIDSIISVFDQISFEEESGQIKDFVEIKTDEINQNIQEVKNALEQIANPDAENVYSLQDIESDISKLRLILNDISSAASPAAFYEITGNISKIVSTLDSLQSTLTQEQISEIKNDFEKLNDDVVSISTRTNQLLLTSDESYKVLTNSLGEFREIVNGLSEKVNYFDTSEITARIEKKVDNITNAAVATANSSKVMREAMIYMGEWIDGASETMGSIANQTALVSDSMAAISERTAFVSEKIAQVDNITSELEELKTMLPDNTVIVNRIEKRFEEQQARIDRLEMNLDRLISMIEEKDDSRIIKKVDKIERQLTKLGANIEKLASYVDEE